MENNQIENNDDVTLKYAIQAFQLHPDIHELAELWCYKEGWIKSDMFRKLQRFYLEGNGDYKKRYQKSI